jgi:hypothetical protein
MIIPIKGLNIVSQIPMVAIRWPCVFIILLCGKWFNHTESVFFPVQGAAQFRQSNVLQLANAFTRDAEGSSDIFQRLRLSPVEAEPLRDDF